MDFTELPADGQGFEQLVRELLFSRGLHVQWSGRGPDGGRDLICQETLSGIFAPQKKTWLIQCKHKAHGGGSVGTGDLDDIVDSCHQHGASGYLLVCSTQPSSAVINRLEGITRATNNNIEATYWDAVTLQRMLSTSGQWSIAQRFMPVSCGDWKLYATEAPNDFIAHFKGYVFHLTNRIESGADHHLNSIRNRLLEIEAIDMPKGHSLRPRCVWYNGKSPEYVWYLDYMHPHNDKPVWSIAELQTVLHEGWALEDGQLYHWDIKYVKFFPFSDHFDDDHFDYYTKYIPNFLTGRPREERSFAEYYATKQELELLEEQERVKRDVAFDNMIKCISAKPFLKVLRAANACPHLIRNMERRLDWNSVFETSDGTLQNLFSAALTIAVFDDDKFHSLVAAIPQGEHGFFRLSRVCVYTPDGRTNDEDELIYDLALTTWQDTLRNQFEARVAFDSFFDSIAAAWTE